jgi:hypothetical protein
VLLAPMSALAGMTGDQALDAWLLTDVRPAPETTAAAPQDHAHTLSCVGCIAATPPVIFTGSAAGTGQPWITGYDPAGNKIIFTGNPSPGQVQITGNTFDNATIGCDCIRRPP